MLTCDKEEEENDEEEEQQEEKEGGDGDKAHQIRGHDCMVHLNLGSLKCRVQQQMRGHDCLVHLNLGSLRAECSSKSAHQRGSV